jgi:hypothetical protein
MDVSSELQDPAALPPAEDSTVHTEQELGKQQEGCVCSGKDETLCPSRGTKLQTIHPRAQ